MNTPKHHLSIIFSLEILLHLVVGCAQNHELLGGALSQPLPPMPAHATLPSVSTFGDVWAGQCSQ